MTLTLKELKEHVTQRYDPDEVVEILDISTEELLEYFEDKLELKRKLFEDDLDDTN